MQLSSSAHTINTAETVTNNTKSTDAAAEVEDELTARGRGVAVTTTVVPVAVGALLVGGERVVPVIDAVVVTVVVDNKVEIAAVLVIPATAVVNEVVAVLLVVTVALRVDEEVVVESARVRLTSNAAARKAAAVEADRELMYDAGASTVSLENTAA